MLEKSDSVCAPTDLSTQLREQGITHLRDFFPNASLERLENAAASCFQAIATQNTIPEHYGFSRSSNSVLLGALRDFGFTSDEELIAPLSTPGLAHVFSETLGREWTCNLRQSWLRNKLAPRHASRAGYAIQNWHQDGALGAHFPPEPGPAIPMTSLITCWIPLNPCGLDSPGLEFIRKRQPSLLHFTELDDASLRHRFPAHEFWAPELAVGDGLIFTNDVLHRTHVLPAMQLDRLSIEYRIFPR